MEADDTEATAEFIEADQRMPALLVGVAELLHHCGVVAINSPSYRLKNRLQAIERETDVA